MKSPLKAVLFWLICLMVTPPASRAQTSADEIIFQAMNDELSRSTSQLLLDKYRPPFYVACQLADAKILAIKATLGSLRQVQENPVRFHSVRLMVGDYTLNNENFSEYRTGYSSSGYLPVPLENDYEAIRRAFWIMSDGYYKSAIERFEQKKTALKQQNKTETEMLDDFSKVSPVNLVLKAVPFAYDKARWETVAADVSGIFKSYDQIMSSTVYLFFINASVYLANSEGTKVKYPVHAACLWINVYAQAEDGEPLTDQLTYCAPTPDLLPSMETIKQEGKQLADNMVALRKAPIFTNSYSGPVIFEGNSVAELFAQKLFNDNGLIASREPVYAVESQSRQGDVNKLDNKVNQRICSASLTIKAVPKTKSFNNLPLVGSFEIDAEGVVPKDELVLVEKGILRTLLNDRVPTPKVKESNGHSRIALTRSGYFASQKAPGVVNISYANGKPLKTFRKKALEEAKKNGLEFIYVVRKLQTFNPGMNREMMMAAARNMPLSKPLAIYRVSVKTGQEQLVRSAVFGDFPMTTFKHILQGSKEQGAYNTLFSKNGLDLPASFIVPQALVFDDVNLEQDKITKPKSRVVPNPVLAHQ